MSVSQAAILKPLPYQRWDEQAVPFCFLVRTFPAHGPQLFSFMMSLLAKRPPELHVFLVNTVETPFLDLSSMVDQANQMAGSIIFHDFSDVINAQHVHRRFSNATMLDKYGYILTDLLLEHVLELKDDSGGALCQYFTVTNGDNLFTSSYFPVIWQAIKRGFNLIGMHFISSHHWPDRECNTHECGPWRGGTDVEVRAGFQVACIDLAAGVFSRDILGSIRFVITEMPDASDRDRWTGADGLFFSNLFNSPGAQAIVISRTLVIHQ